MSGLAPRSDGALAPETYRQANNETLASLDEHARYMRYDVLQEHLPSAWKALGQNEEDESVVVVPSVTLDRVAERGGGIVQAYEERFLFLLLLLRFPRLKVVYITSQPIDPLIIEYYLSLLPGVIPSHARARLSLVAVNDSSPRALTAKLLERPRLLKRLRSLIPDPGRSHLIPYNTTPLERDLALSLGIPMFGADPRHFGFGTKSGCRRLFAEEEIAHPRGVEDLLSNEDLVLALERMRRDDPRVAAAILKLNEGVAGEGNARIDLSGLPAPGASDEREALRRRANDPLFESADVSPGAYFEKLAERGGIVEELLVGELQSPSVQMRITPAGEVEVLSTHDQLLGGPSGQSYLGCRFPADPRYAKLIVDPARRIGARLAREGVIGRFAVDFVVVRRDETQWDAYAIELNLRKGGTTHPFLTLHFLTDGVFDADAGTYVAPSGTEKFLVASDHVESPLLRGLTIDALFEIIALRGLHFDQARQRGIVFHMISCITELGRVGMTSIGDSPEEASRLYEEAELLLLEEAREASRDISLPVWPH